MLLIRGVLCRNILETMNGMIAMTDCPHDYDNPIRKDQAYYVCPLCGDDITLVLVLIHEAEGE